MNKQRKGTPEAESDDDLRSVIKADTDPNDPIITEDLESEAEYGKRLDKLEQAWQAWADEHKPSVHFDDRELIVETPYGDARLGTMGMGDDGKERVNWYDHSDEPEGWHRAEQYAERYVDLSDVAVDRAWAGRSVAATASVGERLRAEANVKPAVDPNKPEGLKI